MRMRVAIRAVLAIAAGARIASAGVAPDGAPPLGVALASRTDGIWADGTARTPAVSFGSFRMRLLSDGLAISDGPGRPGTRLRMMGRAELPLASGVAWLGTGLERRNMLDGASSSGVVEAGALSRLRAVVVDARVSHVSLVVPQAPLLVTSWTSPPGFQSPPDTIPIVPFWVAREARPVAVTTFESAMGWSHARWQVEAWAGLALGPGIAPIRLARLETTRWLGPGLGLTLGFRSAGPRWLGERFLEHPGAELGLRLEPGVLRASPRATAERSPAAPGWSLVRLGAGRYQVRIRVREAGSVALRGDFTSWEPVRLERTGSGWWEAAFEMAPGLHQLELSVDGGAWRPLPDAPTTLSAYGDEVGIVVAR